MISENALRDKLTNNLSVIKPGLTYIDKEKYFPNIEGTRSFIDILARDEENRFVLIEIKKSNQASREALHELIKYINAIKQNKSLKEDEVILLLVSTEWKELFIPFIDFQERVNLSVEGFQLFLDESNNPTGAVKIDEKPSKHQRKLSDDHMFYCYRSVISRNKGIDSYIKAFKQRGVKDYVLIILDFIGSNEDSDDNLNYMIYTSAQRLSNKEYIDLIKKDSGVYEDYENYDNEIYDEDDYINRALHGAAVYDTSPRGYFEYVEIGTPAKFAQVILGSGNWQVKKIIRGGRIKNNELLTDASIINELKGDSGGNMVHYLNSFSMSNKASISVVADEISSCLKYNKIWMCGIHSAIKEMKVLNIKSTCNIMIYNPLNILRSLLYFYRDFQEQPNDNGLLKAQEWFPKYTITCDNDDFSFFYVGMLKDNGNRVDLKGFIDKFYNGSEQLFFMPFISGGMQLNEIKSSRGLGLEYSNFKCVYDKKKKVISYYEFDGYDYEESKPFKLNEDVYKFAFKEKKLINEIEAMFNKRFLGAGFIDLSK